MSRPFVISHRTQMGTMPENTLVGIDAAIEGGADGVEVDVRATSDGELVLLHDASLSRTTTDKRELSEVTLTELREVRVLDTHEVVGEQPVPTLAETLDRINGRALFVIELKEAGLEERVASLLRVRQAADWCWIWSFDPKVVEAARVAMPEVPAWLAFSEKSIERFEVGDPFDVAPRLGAAGLSVGQTAVTAELVERARRRGLLTATWTVNETENLVRVRDAGVDAICGDFPDKTIAALI
jgi:glycerophosphoryl diester phosphodiesterase